MQIKSLGQMCIDAQPSWENIYALLA